MVQGQGDLMSGGSGGSGGSVLTVTRAENRNFIEDISIKPSKQDRPLAVSPPPLPPLPGPIGKQLSKFRYGNPRIARPACRCMPTASVATWSCCHPFLKGPDWQLTGATKTLSRSKVTDWPTVMGCRC